MKYIKEYKEIDWEDVDYMENSDTDVVAYLYNSAYSFEEAAVICMLKQKGDDGLYCVHFIDDDNVPEKYNPDKQFFVNGHEILCSSGYEESVQDGDIFPLTEKEKESVENDKLLIKNDYDIKSFKRTFKYSYLKNIFPKIEIDFN